jgi:hypothetical protein
MEFSNLKDKTGKGKSGFYAKFTLICQVYTNKHTAHSISGRLSSVFFWMAVAAFVNAVQ